jgi:hypothetical protein
MKVIRGTQQAATSKGIESNLYKALESVIQHRIFGISIEGDPVWIKKAQALKSYTSHVQLIGNVLSMGANFTQGHSMGAIEGAGGQFYSPKNWANGMRKMHADTLNVLSDMTRLRHLSKTRLLQEKYNAKSDWSTEQFKFAEGSAAKRALSTNTLYLGNHLAEDSPQTAHMYAILDNIKVTNKNGEYLTKDGITSDRSKAMSIDEAYSVGYTHISKYSSVISKDEFNALSDKDKKDYVYGELYLDPRVAANDRSDNNDPQPISRVVRRLNRQAFGNYDGNNKSKASRTILGMMMYHMRGWMEPGFKSRYKGTLFIGDKSAALGFRILKKEELKGQHINISAETGEQEEGSYVTFIRFVAAIRKDILKAKVDLIAMEWNTLTDHEKANIKKTTAELALAGTFLGLSMMLIAASGDDDDDDYLLTSAYFTRRLYSELRTYTSVDEFLRTTRSPAASLNLLEGTSDLLAQCFDPTELYKSGSRAKQSKLVHKALKVSPFRFMERDTQESLNFLLK